MAGVDMGTKTGYALGNGNDADNEGRIMIKRTLKRYKMQDFKGFF